MAQNVSSNDVELGDVTPTAPRSTYDQPAPSSSSTSFFGRPFGIPKEKWLSVGDLFRSSMPSGHQVEVSARENAPETNSRPVDDEAVRSRDVVSDEVGGTEDEY